MGRPRMNPGEKAEYHTKAKAWLCCDTCDWSIPYVGKPDPTEGDGWPLHRCSKAGFKATPFTRYTTENPTPPIDLTHLWDDKDTEPPAVMIG